MTAVVYRHSAVFFGGFFLAVLWAFWPSYFSRPFDQYGVQFHAHGQSLTFWCAMLVGQAYLIRSGRRCLHAWVGRASYVLVPVVIVTAIRLKHLRMQGFELDAAALYSLASVLFALVAFVVLYGCAIYYRQSAQAHARYVICTVFPLFSPLTDRLIAAHVPAILSWVHRVAGSTTIPFVNVVGFLVADLMVVILAVWDWRANRRGQVFALAAVVLLVFQVAVLVVYASPQWRAFGQWFVTLPLS